MPGQTRSILCMPSLVLLAFGAPLWAQTPAKVAPRDPQSTPARDNLIDLRPKFEKGRESRFKLDLTSTTTQTPVTGKQQPAAPAHPAAPTSRPNQKQPPRRSPTTNPDDADPLGKAPAPGQDGPSKTHFEMDLKLKVTDAKVEEGATVDLVIEHFKVSITGGMLDTEFDSSKPPKSDDIAGMLFQSIAGSTMTLKVDANGNITSVTGGDALAALGQLSGGSAPSPGTGAASASSGQLFSSLFSMNKVSGKAAVGESWENTDTVDSPLLGQFKMITRHTLTSVHGHDANVDLHGRIEPGSEAPGQQPFTIKGSRHDGRYVWDTASGMLSQMQSQLTTELQGKFGGEDEVLTRSESKLSIVRK